MLSEDKLSEVLVVRDENLPGLKCCLQYRGVEAAWRQLGGVYCDVTQRLEPINDIHLNVFVSEEGLIHVTESLWVPQRLAAALWRRTPVPPALPRASR